MFTRSIESEAPAQSQRWYWAAVVLVGIGLTLGLSAISSPPGPDKNVTVKKFTPTGPADDLTNITIEFSKELCSPDSLNIPLLDPPVTFKPRINGIARWIAPDKLRFYPDDNLAPATRYTARVRSRDILFKGNRINDSHEFTFFTPGLDPSFSQFSTMDVPDSADFRRATFVVSFNYPVRAKELENHLTIRGRDNAELNHVDFTVGSNISERDSYQEDTVGYRTSWRVYTEAIPVIDESQEYRAHLGKGLECRDCGESMAEDHTYDFTIAEKEYLVISRVRASNENGGFNIVIDFNRPVRAEDLREHLTVEPEISYVLGDRYSSIVVAGDFSPGDVYTVNISKGLMSRRKQELERDFSTTIEIPDYPPSVSFASRGAYLPSRGAGNLEIESMNIDTLTVEVERVFENNLIYFLTGTSPNSDRNRDMARVGRDWFYRDVPLDYTKNQTLPTTVDMAGIIGDSTRGVYVVYVRNKHQRWQQDSRQVMLTDLGIAAHMADDYLMVWVHSLQTTDPTNKADVRLYSRNNQVLLKGQTDSRGIVVFDDIKESLDGFEPAVITVSKGDDLSYLELANCGLSTDDFDVAGRPMLTRGYEAFMYTERGVYRPGDTCRLVSIVRGVDGALPESFPYIVEIRDPRGRVFKTERRSASSNMDEINLEIPSFAATGRYRVVARIGDDYRIGEASFLVEDFMPERMAVTTVTPEDTYCAGDTVAIDISGKFLFGPPAAGQRATGELALSPKRFHPDGFEDYSFASSNRSFSRTTKDLFTAHLDSTGHYLHNYVVLSDLKPPSMLRATVLGTVYEDGGRSVSSVKQLDIYPFARYLGMRLDLKGFAQLGQAVTADLVCVNPDSTQSSADSVQVHLIHYVYNTVLERNSRGGYHYRSELKREVVDSATVNVTDSGASLTFTPPSNGRFSIEATDGADGHATSREFYVSGWGYAPWSLANPDQIELNLDKQTYEPGEKVTIQVQSPFPGKLLLTVEKDKVLETIPLDLDSNTATIDLLVREDYFPNVYITATVVRPAAEIKEHAPARAFGMAPLCVSTAGRKIDATIEAPAVISPNDSVTVTVHTNAHSGAAVAVALVDAGILSLTNYDPPDPLAFFYGKKRPHLSAYDIYGQVYPETERAASHLSPGGGMAESPGAPLAPPRSSQYQSPINAVRYQPVALWSGVLKTDESGRATATLAVPQFNGELKVMAVVAGDNKFGQATGSIIVRDKIVLMESFPRFIAPMDTVDALVSLFNNTGHDANIAIEVQLDGPATIIDSPHTTVAAKNSAEASARFTLVASAAPGVIKCTIRASSGVDSASVHFELPNRPPQPLKTLYGAFAVTADSAIQFTIPGNWLEGTDHYTLRTSSLATVTLARSIEELLSYPYGCLEQTTSRIFPLLYFNDIARFVQPKIFGGRGYEYFIQEGIERIEQMATSDGRFTYWPGGNTISYWSSVYATHFLVEARKAGYEVNNDVYGNALAMMSRIARGHQPDDGQGSSVRVYAALVLAKAGRMENRILNHLRRFHTDNLPAFTNYQLAEVFALSGDMDYARTLVPADIQPATFEPETGGYFSSGVRTNAILLDMLLEADSTNPSIPVLAQSLLEGARIGVWRSTQETAFALMALGKYFRGQQPVDFTGHIEIVGDTTYAIDTTAFLLRRDDLGGKQVRVAIAGMGPCFVYWQATGVSSDVDIEEYDRGIRVRREYLTENGSEIDLNSIQPGDKVLCHIVARSQTVSLYNVVISDLLPACFEIENPRLSSTPDIGRGWRDRSWFDYKDIRDDRLLLFTDLRENREVNAYYTVRCIASGRFVVPPVAAECMYNPAISGAASSNRLHVERPK